jgi:hypothetical protein
VHWLDPVRAALDAASERVEVFFRDDDAGWDDARLLALLDRFAAHELPLDLAVIPAALGPSLAPRLRERSASQRLRVHQHGYTHRDHEPEGRKHEFGPSRTPEQQRADIAAGRARLHDLLGDLPQPIFTPPWNRCTVATGHALTDLGFRILSREAKATPLRLAGLAEVPIHVDWVKPDRAQRLAAAFSDQGRAGVMFHHAVMDAEELGRADELLALLATHPHVAARPIEADASQRSTSLTEPPSPRAIRCGVSGTPTPGVDA